MVNIRSREQIIRHVGVDIRVVITPRDRCRDGRHVADELLVSQVELRVGVALDLVVAAGPAPARVPCYAVAADVVYCRALRAAALVFAPEIVVDCVGGLGGGAVLVAELLGESRGGQSEEGGGRLHG